MYPKTDIRIRNGRWQLITHFDSSEEIFVSTVDLYSGDYAMEMRSMDAMLGMFADGMSPSLGDFETLPKDESGWREDLKRRYATREEAEKGHMEVVAELLAEREKK